MSENEPQPAVDVDIFLSDGVDSVVCPHCGTVTVHTWTGTPQWTSPLDCGCPQTLMIQTSHPPAVGPLRYFLQIDNAPWREMTEAQYRSLTPELAEWGYGEDIEFKWSDGARQVRGIVTRRYPPI